MFIEARSDCGSRRTRALDEMNEIANATVQWSGLILSFPNADWLLVL